MRLSEAFNLTQADGETDLLAAAEALGATGLVEVLEQYEVDSGLTGRLVDLEDTGLLDVEYVEPGDPTTHAPEGYLWPPRETSGPVKLRRRWPAQEHTAGSGGRPPSLRELEARAAGSELRPIHSLASYWHLDAAGLPLAKTPGPGETWRNGWKPTHERTVRRLVRQLNELPEVDLAYRELAATDPSPVDPKHTYAPTQEYLKRAPAGIDAVWAWDQARGFEEGMVAFADLEQGWIDHVDIGSGPAFQVQNHLAFGSNRHGKGDYRGHHGTAVLGEVLGRHDDNGVGIQGIARDARWVLLSSHYDEDGEVSGNVANAIRHLIPRMEPGDVLLLEVQRSYLPTEVDPLDLDAIRLAVAHGIIVIEAAGNGNADLDRYIDLEGRRVLNRRHPDFRESGALMVAAARAELPHNRLSGRVGVGSNYGSRIDCFAHGDRVVTSGYGDLNGYLETPGPAQTAEELEAASAPRAYSAYFGGTSAAAPIIAGAALLVQGMHEFRTGTRLSPWEMRRLLASPSTGTRQGRGVRGRIGVMPDLRRVLREGLALTPNLYLRDGVDNEGRLPLAARTSCSPDIVVMETGSGRQLKPFDDDPASLSELTGVDGYEIFVRVHNRGHQDSGKPDIRLFRSPLATLVTPEMWDEIAVPMPLDVSVSSAGEPTWVGPFQLPAKPELAAAPQGRNGGREYCFTALVRDEHDRDLVTPPDQWPYFDWRRYLAFLRWNHGVACRSVSDVDAGQGAVLRFLVTGAPDRAREFDLEVVRELCRETELDLVAHAALATTLRRRRLWPAKQADGDPRSVHLTLPRRPRQLIKRVRLLAGAGFPCSFVVGRTWDGNRIAIRQLYRGREVGRITWRFRGKS